MKGRSIIRAICCLLLALIFWFVVKYTGAGAYSTSFFNFG